MHASKISPLLDDWQKKKSLFYQTGTYLPRACYSYLNVKNKALAWHGISNLRSSEVSLASGRIKGIFFSCFEHTDCTFCCSVEDLTRDFCAGLGAGALLWDSPREWIMSCAAPRSREETRDSKRRTERSKKKDSFVRVIPLLNGQRAACSRRFGSCDGTVSFFALHQQAPSSGVGLGKGYPGQEVIGGSKTVTVFCPLLPICAKESWATVGQSQPFWSAVISALWLLCVHQSSTDPWKNRAMILCIVPHPHPTPYSSKGHSIAYSLSLVVREKRDVLSSYRRLGFWKQALLFHFILDLKLTAHIQGVKGQREWDLGTDSMSIHFPFTILPSRGPSLEF